MQQNQVQGQQQQQPVMMKPPQVITTKDYQFLKDQLSWELLAMKKCRHYAQESTDPEIKQAIDKAGQMHQRHYQLLLKHLQNNNMEEMKKVPQTQ
ncbi:MAG: ferritin-like domain-containing protein [Bacillota bacterium]